MPETPASWRRRWWPIIPCALVGALVPLAEITGLGAAASMLPFVAVFAAPIVPAALLAMMSTRLRRRAPRVAVLATVVLASTYAGTRLRWPVRRAVFASLAARSAQLTVAVDAYATDHGAPPASLEQLVPHYLEAVPTTGLLGHRRYEYRKFEQSRSMELFWYDLGSRNGAGYRGLWKYPDGDPGHAILVVAFEDSPTATRVEVDRLPENHSSEMFQVQAWKAASGDRVKMASDLARTKRLIGLTPRELEETVGPPSGTRSARRPLWEVRVPCSLGPLNWDVFFYWPGGEYPQHIYGGSVERMGSWAYVHE